MRHTVGTPGLSVRWKIWLRFGPKLYIVVVLPLIPTVPCLPSGKDAQSKKDNISLGVEDTQVSRKIHNIEKRAS